MAYPGGNTTKETYVSTYDTDIDPRAMPGFNDPNFNPQAYNDYYLREKGEEDLYSEGTSASGHRLRKKYTTTTVTTVTTTTVLLPKMQEALVMPSNTQYYLNDVPASGAGPVVNYQGQQVQLLPDGSVAQPWIFTQQNKKDAYAEDSDHAPTLEQLGITSYFRPDGASAPAYREAPYEPGRDAQQPWIAAEAREELEGGNNYYRR